MKITKPLLAGKAPEDLSLLSFPVIASPKLDGVRALIVDGKAVTRTFKPIPNDYVRKWMEANLPEGSDGELLFRDPFAAFKEVSGAVRRKTGEPDIVFAAFDIYSEEGFMRRINDAMAVFGTKADCDLYGGVAYCVEHIEVYTVEELVALNTKWCALGYEGTMVRDPNGPYKMGRSSTKQGILLKVKEFADEEAEVIGTYEKMHNANEAKKDAFGRTERSTHAENKVGLDTLGGIVVRFLSDGTESRVGGFLNLTMKERKAMWDDRENLIGLTAKIKHQPDPGTGGKRRDGEQPRFAIWIGWRDLTLDG